MDISNKMFGVVCATIEPVASNSYASDWLKDHMRELRDLTISYGCSYDKVWDLLQDVWISLVNDEANGKAFNENYESKNKNYNNIYTVDMFVKGRIKRYALNPKYSDRYMQCKTSKKSDGQTQIDMCIVAATPDIVADDLAESNNQFQVALATAAHIDDLDGIEELNSIKEQIDYCTVVLKNYGINFIRFLRNIGNFENIIRDKKYIHGCEVFSDINEAAKEHKDLFEDICSIIKFHGEHYDAFQLVLESYN